MSVFVALTYAMAAIPRNSLKNQKNFTIKGTRLFYFLCGVGSAIGGAFQIRKVILVSTPLED